MKLHEFTTSHFCEKARWVLDYKRVEYSRVTVAYRSKAHKAMRDFTGHTTLPVLETDTGRWIRDSTRIAVELERMNPEPALLPTDPDLRTQAQVWDDWADDVLAKKLYALYVDAITSDEALRRRSYDDAFGQSPLGSLYPLLNGVFAKRYRESAGAGGERVDQAVERVSELIELLDERLDGRSYLVGDAFTLADLSVATMLTLGHRPPEAGPHPVVTSPWRAPRFPMGPAADRVLAWQTRILAEHRGSNEARNDAT